MRAIAFAFALMMSFFSEIRAGIVPNTAPEFKDISGWINSDPLLMENMRGRVVLVDFWSYSCINCLRTLPYLNRWYATYKDKGFVVIGVHSPEFQFEHSKENVAAAIKRYGIHYPVALDNHFATWRAYSNSFWPTKYLIDQEGRIRFRQIGEGGYFEMENAIRKLLDLAPLKRTGSTLETKKTTPEIYLGSRRSENYSEKIRLKPNSIDKYTASFPLSDDDVALVGLWRVAPDSVTSAGSSCKILINCLAAKVHMVLAGSSAEPITVWIDGKPLSDKYYTHDMDAEGQIFMDGDRKYDIADFRGELKRRDILIKFPPGISAYTFTFGQ